MLLIIEKKVAIRPMPKLEPAIIPNVRKRLVSAMTGVSRFCTALQTASIVNIAVTIERTKAPKAK